MSEVLDRPSPINSIFTAAPERLAAVVPEQPERSNRQTLTVKQMESYAKLEPTDEDAAPDADLTTADLLLDAAMVAALQPRAEALARATAAMVKAEQAHASAKRQAGRLAYLNSDRVSASADVLTGVEGAMDRLKALQADIAQAQEAAEATPVLAERLQTAKHEQGACFGATRKLARQCMAEVRLKAAAELSAAAARVTRAMAVMDAAIELDTEATNTHSGGWHPALMALSIPAMPRGLGAHDRNEVSLHFKPMLASAQHPRFIAMGADARGKLKAQFAAAMAPAGLAAHNVL